MRMPHRREIPSNFSVFLRVRHRPSNSPGHLRPTPMCSPPHDINRISPLHLVHHSVVLTFSGVGCCRQLAVNSHRKTLIITADNPHGKPVVTLFRQLFSTVWLKMAVASQVLRVPNGACIGCWCRDFQLIVHQRLRAGIAQCKFFACLTFITRTNITFIYLNRDTPLDHCNHHSSRNVFATVMQKLEGWFTTSWPSLQIHHNEILPHFCRACLKWVEQRGLCIWIVQMANVRYGSY